MFNSGHDLNIYLFGSPGIIQDGQLVHLSRRKIYGLLAFTYFSILWGGREFLPTDESRIKVRQFIKKALELNPDNLRARMVLAGSLWEWDFDFSAAEIEYEKILRINPNHIESLCWYSELKMNMGKHEDMYKLVQRAYRLNPLDIVTLDHLYRYYLITLQYRRCLETLDRIDELSPGHSFVYFLRAIMYTRIGQYETAVEYIRKALVILPRLDAYRSVLAYAYGCLGETKEALQIITEMITDRENGEWIRAFDISLAYYSVGKTEDSLKWLEQSWREDRLYTFNAIAQPFYGELNWDPRFQDIVGRTGLPQQPEYIRKAIDIQRTGEKNSRAAVSKSG